MALENIGNGGYNYNITRGVSKTSKGSEYFFKKLSAIAEDKAKEIVEQKASIMYNVLRFRGQMEGGNGRYPKWSPNMDNKREAGIKSKESYKNWHKEIMPNGNIRLFNDTGADDGEFAYPLLLLYGHSKSPRWGFTQRGPASRSLKDAKRVNEQGFSTQMPNGIDPWMKLKVDDLKESLKKALQEIK